MCGLTGVAINPARKDQRKLAREILTFGLATIQKRGAHATGVATIAADGHSDIFKRAVPANLFVTSQPFNEFMASRPADTMIGIGHTRHATHANSGLDDAAHPFHVGKVTGAHNGIIYNWLDIEKDYGNKDERWINDSQAPFGLLNAIKAPSTALGKLDGYWALTWTKGKSLFLCRTSEAPLACAYIASKQMLIWNSEVSLLRSMLSYFKIDEKDASMWEPTAGTIYRYAPNEFDAQGTHVEKTKASFEGRKVKKSWAGINTARPPMMNTAQQTDWFGVQKRIGEGSKSGGRSRRSISLFELEDLLMETMAENEKLRTEVDYLFDVVRAAGLLGDAEVDGLAPDGTEEEIADPCDVPVAGQLQITDGNRAVMESWVARCKVCGHGTEAGELFKASFRGHVWAGLYHEECGERNEEVELIPLPAK